MGQLGEQLLSMERLVEMKKVFCHVMSVEAIICFLFYDI